MNWAVPKRFVKAVRDMVLRDDLVKSVTHSQLLSNSLVAWVFFFV